MKDNDTEALSNPNDTHHKAEIESRNLLTPSEEKQTNKGTYKTRKMDVIRGTGTEICSLKSVDRKAWLYLGKINKGCKEDDVVNFLTTKFPENKIQPIVEKISREESTSSSFKLGIDFELLEKVNKEDFWPKGVMVKRFFFSDNPKPNR